MAEVRLRLQGPPVDLTARSAYKTDTRINKQRATVRMGELRNATGDRTYHGSDKDSSCTCNKACSTHTRWNQSRDGQCAGADRCAIRGCTAANAGREIR